MEDFGGELPTNMFDIGNSRTSTYNEYCREKELEIHPAKFPQQIPEFFIKMLTDKGDRVYDPFGGSCTTGVAAEGLGRKWICTDLEREYLLGAKGWFGEDYLKAINKKKKRK